MVPKLTIWSSLIFEGFNKNCSLISVFPFYLYKYVLSARKCNSFVDCILDFLIDIFQVQVDYITALVGHLN